MGPETTSLLIFSISVLSSLFHSPPYSSVRVRSPLLPALLPQWVKPPLQPLAVNPPPLPQILSLLVWQYMPPVHPSSMHAAHPPPLPVSLQWVFRTPIIYPTVRTMFLLFWPCFFGKACLFIRLQLSLLFSPSFQLSFSTIRAYYSASICAYSSSSAFLKRGVPPLQPLAVCAPPHPLISVSLRGIEVHPLLPSSMRAYDPLIW